MKKTFLIASILISTSQSYASWYKDNSFLPEIERGAWVFAQDTSRMPLPQQSLSGYACTLPTQPSQTLLEPLSDPYTLVIEDFSFCPDVQPPYNPPAHTWPLQMPTLQAYPGYNSSNTASYQSPARLIQLSASDPIRLCKSCIARGVRLPVMGASSLSSVAPVPTVNLSQTNNFWPGPEVAAGDFSQERDLNYETSYMQDPSTPAQTLVCDELFFSPQESVHPAQPDTFLDWTPQEITANKDAAFELPSVSPPVVVAPLTHGKKRRRHGVSKDDTSSRRQRSSSPSTLIQDERPQPSARQNDQSMALYQYARRLLDETLRSQEAGPHTQEGREKLQEAARVLIVCHKSSSALRWHAYLDLAITKFHLGLLDESDVYLKRIANSSSSGRNLKKAALDFAPYVTKRREDLREQQESAAGKEATSLTI